MGVLPNLKMCVARRRKQPLGEKEKNEQITKENRSSPTLEGNTGVQINPN